MKYQSNRFAVIDKPTPEAALYFDKVYCLDGSTKSVFPTANNFYIADVTRDIPDFILETQNTIKIDNWDFKRIITKKSAELVNKNFKGEIKVDFAGLTNSIENKEFHNFSDFKRFLTHENEDFNVDLLFRNLLIASTTHYHRDEGKYVVPIFENTNTFNWLNGTDLKEGIELALLDLPLVQGRNIEWEHVKQVREDKDSIKSLRNLRLFLDDIEKDKGKSYAQDFLLQKIDNYESAAKKHGFKLFKEPLKAIIALEHIPKILACGLFSIIDPSIATLAGVLSLTEIGGAIQEVAGLTLEVTNQKMTKGLDSKYHDVEYLIKIKKQLEK